MTVSANQNLIYKAVPELDRDTALKELDSGFAERAVEALLALAFYDPDGRWVQNICRKYSGSSNEDVRRIAILCFGHLARIHRTLETELVVPIVIEAMEDPSAYLSGTARDALGDILMFCIPDNYQRTAAVANLGSERIDRILLGLFEIAKNDSDSQFAQERCLEYSHHPNPVIRGVALNGFATIICQHRQIDLEATMRLLAEAAGSDGYPGECARSAIDSIETHLLAIEDVQ